MPLDLVIGDARLAGAAPDAPTVEIAVSSGLITAIDAGRISTNAYSIDAGTILFSACSREHSLRTNELHDPTPVKGRVRFSDTRAMVL